MRVAARLLQLLASQDLYSGTDGDSAINLSPRETARRSTFSASPRRFVKYKTRPRCHPMVRLGRPQASVGVRTDFAGVALVVAQRALQEPLLHRLQDTLLRQPLLRHLGIHFIHSLPRFISLAFEVELFACNQHSTRGQNRNGEQKKYEPRGDSDRCRRDHFPARSTKLRRLVLIGLCSRNRRRSSASSWAVV
jgi:hypothetical protein